MITDAEYAEISRRMQDNALRVGTRPPVVRLGQRVTVPREVRPTGRLPKPAMNPTETAYSQYLDLQQKAGEIAYHKFEAITIKLGPDCRLTPDFLVMYPDGHLESHDTKGTTKIKLGKKAGGTKFYAKEDALVKARVVAGNFVIPIYFLHKEKNGEWTKTPIGEKA